MNDYLRNLRELDEMNLDQRPQKNDKIDRLIFWSWLLYLASFAGSLLYLILK